MNTCNIEKKIFFNKQPESTSLDLFFTPLLSLNIIFNVVTWYIGWFDTSKKLANIPLRKLMVNDTKVLDKI